MSSEFRDIVDVAEEIVKHFKRGDSSLFDKDKVILLFIDGLHIEYAKKLRSIRGAEFAVINTLRLSSTAPVITSFHLAKYPGEHGIYGWTVYSDLFGEIITPLPYLGERGRINTKAHLLVKDFDTIFEQIGEEAECYYFGPREIVNSSTYTAAITRGAKTFGYSSISEAIIKVRELIRKDTKMFIEIYYYPLDHICHYYGTSSMYVREELKIIDYLIKRIKNIAKGKANVAIISDHGMVDINRRKFIKIDSCVCNNSEFIVGEPRYIFIRPKEEYFDELKKYIESVLKKKKVEFDMIELDKKTIEDVLGCYTDRVKHLEGSLFIQLKDDSIFGLFWRSVREFDKKAWHGGYTEDEIKVPLIII